MEDALKAKLAPFVEKGFDAAAEEKEAIEAAKETIARNREFRLAKFIKTDLFSEEGALRDVSNEEAKRETAEQKTRRIKGKRSGIVAGDHR